jgi:NADH dehydrogenase [ubiquinone] 1 alpha subcomplex assembly factor 7
VDPRRAPEPVALRRARPGRGTLAADALRAMQRYGLEPQVHLVEGSPSCRRCSARRCRRRVPRRPRERAGDGPVLLVANEFLDALPVRQLVMTDAGWREVMVATDAAGRFVPVAGDRPMDAAVPEARRAAESARCSRPARRRPRSWSEAAGGSRSRAARRCSSTTATPRRAPARRCQAVRAHRKVDPFAARRGRPDRARRFRRRSPTSRVARRALARHGAAGRLAARARHRGARRRARRFAPRSSAMR